VAPWNHAETGMLHGIALPAQSEHGALPTSAVLVDEPAATPYCGLERE
jgi:hypothetical protein